MGMRTRFAHRALLALVVILHLAVCVIHGQAHAGAQVPLTRAAALFVYGVILIGPVVGLAIVVLGAPRVGGWVGAAAFAGALVFGVLNHFVIAGSDHVSHVPTAWRTLFASTAALLVGLEAIGSAVAAWGAVDAGRTS
jgi:hypothetical protein